MPEWYYLQCQHYMETLGKDGWYLAVLIFGKGFQYTYMERDEELLRDLVSIEEDFWENHVQAGVMPAPDGSKGADELIRKYFHTKTGVTTQLIGFDDRISRRNELSDLIKKLQTEQKTIDQELKMYLGKETGADRYLGSLPGDLERDREQPDRYGTAEEGAAGDIQGIHKGAEKF